MTTITRRGFVSLLVGAAGAPFVSWRGLVTPTIFIPPAPKLVWVSGLEIVQLAIPHEWQQGYKINTDFALVRSDLLELCREQYARRMEFVYRLGKGERRHHIPAPMSDASWAILK